MRYGLQATATLRDEQCHHSRVASTPGGVCFATDSVIEYCRTDEGERQRYQQQRLLQRKFRGTLSDETIVRALIEDARNPAMNAYEQNLRS